MTNGQRVSIFTAPSVEALIHRLAERLYRLCRKSARDRWWWCRKQERQDIKALAHGTRSLVSEWAPGLRCHVRVAWRRPHRRRLKPSIYLLVDFHQVSTFTEDDWIQACHEATPDRCRSLMEIRKQVTLEIRLGGLPSFRRSPWQRAVRKADSWRFDPEYLSPTQELIQQLRQKGNEEGAAHLQAKLDALPPEVQRRRAKRGAFHWRTAWLQPQEEKAEDLRFLLTLILLQEEMIPEDLRAQAANYLKRFRGVSDAGTAFLVLDKLRRQFTEPEDWRALAEYIKLVVRGETKKEGPDHRTAGEDPTEIDEQEDPSVGIVPISTDRELAESYEEDVRRANREALNRPRGRDWASPSRYSVEMAVYQLDSEGWKISPDTLYDWIHARKLSAWQEKGWWRLDGDCLEEARRLLRERQERRVLMKGLVQIGKSPEAARKFLQRRRQARKTPVEIAHEVKEGKRP